MKGAKQFRQLLYGSQITTSYGYDPLDRLLLLSKLSFRFVYQLQDFLRPAAQQESFIGKDNCIPPGFLLSHNRSENELPVIRFDECYSECKVILVDCFAFGGTNIVLLLERNNGE